MMRRSEWIKRHFKLVLRKTGKERKPIGNAIDKFLCFGIVGKGRRGKAMKHQEYSGPHFQRTTNGKLPENEPGRSAIRVPGDCVNRAAFCARNERVSNVRCW